MEIEYYKKTECPFSVSGHTRINTILNNHYKPNIVGGEECVRCVYFSYFFKVEDGKSVVNCSYNLSRGT